MKVFGILVLALASTLGAATDNLPTCSCIDVKQQWTDQTTGALQGRYQYRDPLGKLVEVDYTQNVDGRYEEQRLRTGTDIIEAERLVNDLENDVSDTIESILVSSNHVATDRLASSIINSLQSVLRRFAGEVTIFNPVGEQLSESQIVTRIIEVLEPTLIQLISIERGEQAPIAPAADPNKVITSVIEQISSQIQTQIRNGLSQPTSSVQVRKPEAIEVVTTIEETASSNSNQDLVSQIVAQLTPVIVDSVNKYVEKDGRVRNVPSSSSGFQTTHHQRITKTTSTQTQTAPDQRDATFQTFGQGHRPSSHQKITSTRTTSTHSVPSQPIRQVSQGPSHGKFGSHSGFQTSRHQSNTNQQPSSIGKFGGHSSSGFKKVTKTTTTTTSQGGTSNQLNEVSPGQENASFSTVEEQSGGFQVIGGGPGFDGSIIQVQGGPGLGQEPESSSIQHFINDAFLEESATVLESFISEAVNGGYASSNGNQDQLLRIVLDQLKDRFLERIRTESNTRGLALPSGFFQSQEYRQLVARFETRMRPLVLQTITRVQSANVVQPQEIASGIINEMQFQIQQIASSVASESHFRSRLTQEIRPKVTQVIRQRWSTYTFGSGSSITQDQLIQQVIDQIISTYGGSLTRSDNVDNQQVVRIIVHRASPTVRALAASTVRSKPSSSATDVETEVSRLVRVSVVRLVERYSSRYPFLKDSQAKEETVNDSMQELQSLISQEVTRAIQMSSNANNNNSAIRRIFGSGMSGMNMNMVSVKTPRYQYSYGVDK